MQTSGPLERVLLQAMNTFAVPTDGFPERLDDLKRALNSLDCRAVGLDPRLLHSDVHQLNAGGDPNLSPAVRRRQTPVTYIKVFENKWITAGVFVLRDRARIPFHDHPYMCGLMKVLCGQIKVQSYTAKQRDYSRRRVTHLAADKLPEALVGPGDDACILYPHVGNIHQVETVDGPSAFFDLMSPPYKTVVEEVGPRRCRFFKEIRSKDYQLTAVSQHKGYWNDESPYRGPRLNIRRLNF